MVLWRFSYFLLYKGMVFLIFRIKNDDGVNEGIWISWKAFLHCGISCFIIVLYIHGNEGIIIV